MNEMSTGNSRENLNAATACGETHPHDRHEFLVGFRRHDCPGAPGCTGSRFCEADVHVHGCFADKNGNCDDPGEHMPPGLGKFFNKLAKQEAEQDA